MTTIAPSDIELQCLPEGHFYGVPVGDGTPELIPSVSTYLDVVRYKRIEDAIVRRKMDELFAETFDLYDESVMQKHISPLNFRLKLKTRLAKIFRKRSSGPEAAMGTLIHKAVEATCRQMMGESGVVLPECPEGDSYGKAQLEAALSGFLRWAEKVDFVPLAIECPVAHLPLYYAGTFDIKGLVDTVCLTIDVKTGAKIYDRHKVQVYSYRVADEWMGYGQKPEGQMILKLGQTRFDDPFTAVPVEDDEEYIKYLMHCRSIWERRAQEG